MKEYTDSGFASYYRHDLKSLFYSPISDFDLENITEVKNTITVLKSKEFLRPEEIIYAARTYAKLCTAKTEGSSSACSGKNKDYLEAVHECIEEMRGLVKTASLLGQIQRLERKSSYSAYENTVLAAAEEVSAVPILLNHPEESSNLYEKALAQYSPEKILQGLLDRDSAISSARDLYLMEAYTLTWYIYAPYRHVTEACISATDSNAVTRYADTYLQEDTYNISRTIIMRLLKAVDESDKSIQLRYIFYGAWHTKYGSIILDEDLNNKVGEAVLTHSMNKQFIYYLTRTPRFSRGVYAYVEGIPFVQQHDNFKDACTMLWVKLCEKMETWNPVKSALTTWVKNDFIGVATMANYQDSDLKRTTINLLGQIARAEGILTDRYVKKLVDEKGISEAEARYKAEGMKFDDIQVAQVISGFLSRNVSPDSVRNARKAKASIAVSSDDTEGTYAPKLDKATPLYGTASMDPEAIAICKTEVQNILLRANNIADNDVRIIAQKYLQSAVDTANGLRKRTMSRKELERDYIETHYGATSVAAKNKVTAAFRILNLNTNGNASANPGYTLPTSNSFDQYDPTEVFESLDEIWSSDPDYIRRLFTENA